MRLPVDLCLPAVVEAVSAHGAAVLVAPPGAGKTTRVPPALPGKVLVLEPRRLAARMAARRVGAEIGDHQVGWQVRFESRVGPSARVVFVTEGVLLRRLSTDPMLGGVDVVVLDEFHERHLQTDVALAMVARLRALRGLRLVVMSATMDPAPVAAFLGGCPVVRSSGRVFPVDVSFDARTDERPLEVRVAAAVRGLSGAGDVLVFLPGAAEIRRCMAALEGLAGTVVMPLHGDLPPEMQDAAVGPAPAGMRKVILSTNVAESSVTVEGVTAVVDSGLARVASHEPWSGLPVLQTRAISRASADQRAGRAGRTGPGRVVRLYTRHDHALRPTEDVPEMLRADLAEMVLALRASALGVEDLAWLQAPPEDALAAAEVLLRRLGAVDTSGALTALGRRMAALPLHPRLARLALAAADAGLAAEGARLAAVLSERPGRRFGTSAGPPRPSTRAAASDVLEAMALRDESVARAASQVLQALGRTAGGPPRDAEDVLLHAILLAFPDRVARRPSPRGSRDLVLAAGGSAVLDMASVVHDAEWLVAVAVSQTGRGGPRVTRASRIEPEWLLDLDGISEEREVVWNASRERAETVERLLYERITLDETRRPAAAAAESSRLLFEAAWKLGVAAFADLDRFLSRLRFVASVLGAGVEVDVREALRGLCEGRGSFAELREAAAAGDLHSRLARQVGPSLTSQLDHLAPEHVSLPRRKRVRVEYEEGRPPWIASRLQDFFGLTDGPRIAGGKVPLTLHLLAPSQRPVQVTSDLAGFWTRTYPSVRRELMRRYPKHPWPEDPVTGDGGRGR